MTIAATTQLYGQPIFFWIMGTVLVGYSIDKHGWHSASPWHSSRCRYRRKNTAPDVRYMFLTAASRVRVGCRNHCHDVSDRNVTGAAIRALTAQSGGEDQFRRFMTLGTMYASVAGGTATVRGVPHNAIACRCSNGSRGGSWVFEWMAAGVRVRDVLIVFYTLLWL